MLTWYNNLYIGNTAKRNINKIVRRLNHKKPANGIYVITLASNEKNQLDIIHSNFLVQSVVYRSCPMVVGIAKGYEEALELVTKITEAAVQTNGTADLRQFLAQR